MRPSKERLLALSASSGFRGNVLEKAVRLTQPPERDPKPSLSKRPVSLKRRHSYKPISVQSATAFGRY